MILHVLAFCVALALGAEAEDHTDAPRSFAPPKPVTSGSYVKVVSNSRRIIVIGSSLSENADMASAAEEALNRVERLLGLPVPFTRMDPIRLILQHGTGTESSGVARAEGWADRQLIQRLMVNEPERVDQEDILEDLCRLICARYVIARQTSEARRARLGRAPDWLAVGVAQNLYSTLRARNAEIMLEEWEKGNEFTLAEVLELDWLPAGRWGEKAAAGLFVGLLASQAEHELLFRRLFASAARGVSITPAVLSAADPYGRTPADWEKEWDIWIAAQSRIVRVGRSEIEDRLGAVEAELDVRPHDLGVPESESLPVRLSLAELIEKRYERWAEPLATLVAFRIRALGIGQPKPVWDITRAYSEFFEAVAASRSEGWFRRRFWRKATTKMLRAKLAEADARLRKLREDLDKPSEEFEMAQWGGARDLEMRRFRPRAERLRWADQM